MLPIAAQAVHSNFEFLGTIAEAHEAEHPQDDPNSFSTDIFDGANINSLTVVSQPISKVHTFHVELAKLFTSCSTGHEDIE